MNVLIPVSTLWMKIPVKMSALHLVTRQQSVVVTAVKVATNISQFSSIDLILGPDLGIGPVLPPWPCPMRNTTWIGLGCRHLPHIPPPAFTWQSCGEYDIT